MRLPLALLTLLALPAAAQDWPPGALIAALSGDWNGDGAPDLAVLTQGGDGDETLADLTLYHGDGRRLVAVLHVPGVAFSGVMWGQTPGLRARSETSFILASEQTGIGRHPWTQEVTIAFRNGDHVVAGFTHATYDRLDASSRRCDLNLLTGGWERVHHPGAEEGEDPPPERASGSDGPRAFPLAELDAEFFPAPCEALFR